MELCKYANSQLYKSFKAHNFPLFQFKVHITTYYSVLRILPLISLETIKCVIFHPPFSFILISAYYWTIGHFCCSQSMWINLRSIRWSSELKFEKRVCIISAIILVMIYKQLFALSDQSGCTFRIYLFLHWKLSFTLLLYNLFSIGTQKEILLFSINLKCMLVIVMSYLVWVPTEPGLS